MDRLFISFPGLGKSHFALVSSVTSGRYGPQKEEEGDNGTHPGIREADVSLEQDKLRLPAQSRRAEARVKSVAHLLQEAGAGVEVGGEVKARVSTPQGSAHGGSAHGRAPETCLPG